MDEVHLVTTSSQPVGEGVEGGHPPVAGARQWVLGQAKVTIMAWVPYWPSPIPPDRSVSRP